MILKQNQDFYKRIKNVCKQLFQMLEVIYNKNMLVINKI